VWIFRHLFRLPARAIRERGQSERFPAASVRSAQTISMRNPVFHHLIHSSFTSRDSRRRNCQPCNPIKNRGEQSPWHSHFGHLERHVLGVACHLRPDLDELLSQRSERPVLNILRQCQSSQEVRQVVTLDAPTARSRFRLSTAGHAKGRLQTRPTVGQRRSHRPLVETTDSFAQLASSKNAARVSHGS